MDNQVEKEHICARMVQFLENRKIVIGKWEAENGISNGYLRRSAKDRTNIGIDLIDNFLDKFPEVDVNWLITGRVKHESFKEKSTYEPKQQTVQDIAELIEEIEHLKRKAQNHEDRIIKLEKSTKKPDKPANLQKA